VGETPAQRAERGEKRRGCGHSDRQTPTVNCYGARHQRSALLNHARPEASVAFLARTLNRDYKRVHEDVEALESAGLIQRGAQGLHTGYDEIRARIAL
jgi:hypothetical protein